MSKSYGRSRHNGKTAGRRRRRGRRRPTRNPVQGQLRQAFRQDQTDYTTAHRLHHDNVNNLHTPTYHLHHLNNNVAHLYYHLNDAYHYLVNANTLHYLNLTLANTILILGLSVILSLVTQVGRLIRARTVRFYRQSRILNVKQTLHALPFASHLTQRPRLSHRPFLTGALTTAGINRPLHDFCVRNSSCTVPTIPPSHFYSWNTLRDWGSVHRHRGRTACSDRVFSGQQLQTCVDYKGISGRDGSPRLNYPHYNIGNDVIMLFVPRHRQERFHTIGHSFTSSLVRLGGAFCHRRSTSFSSAHRTP